MSLVTLIRRWSFLFVVLFPVCAVGAPAAWVQKSNADAAVLLDVIGKFSPEQASSYGLKQFDPYVTDEGPDLPARSIAAFTAAREDLQRKLAAESDAKVREDIEIMIDDTNVKITGIEVRKRYAVPFLVPGKTIFQGIFTLLNPESDSSRHAAATERLRRYVGLVPGSKPLTELVRARFEAAASDPKLIGPFRGEVEQELANTSRYVDGVRKLFAANALTGADEALAALDHQLHEFDAWARASVLPRCRTDFRVPPELYAQMLREVGLNIAPDRLIAAAELEFSEVSIELQTLARQVAKAHGWPESDYRDVIHRLKQEQLRPDTIESYYRQTIIPTLEKEIRENRVVTLPNRPMAMRIASEAESAVQPAPHMQSPPLINNHGERGAFILPLGNPSSKGDSSEAYDDFTFAAGAWTLTAHEGRPGHELQFDRMVEGGVSQARAIFAFNSVNVEGWALYCESEMQPYEPLDGQLIVLQMRLLRAVRAFADPMLNLGRMSEERAHELLVKDVCLSEAFAREELNRFTFRWRGQAPSYFYGFTRLLQLRAATQVALGDKFDRMAFNDFVVNQGLLPPALMEKAVREEFIPAVENSKR